MLAAVAPIPWRNFVKTEALGSSAIALGYHPKMKRQLLEVHVLGRTVRLLARPHACFMPDSRVVGRDVLSAGVRPPRARC